MTDAQRIVDLEAENRALLDGASNAARRIHILEKRVAELEAAILEWGSVRQDFVRPDRVATPETFGKLGNAEHRLQHIADLLSKDKTNG